ncbi:MAG TPA: WcaI family glycosyltransferase [Planctomycetota bacterium]|jgi:colanic acid biosynthesis glycosyl transferase WcaI
MRVLVYGINYAPEPTGIGKYTAEMCEWLAENGAEVRVVTAPPHYPAWKISPGYSAHAYRHERSSAVSIWRCPLFVPRQPSGIKRLLHYLTFVICSAPIVMLQCLTWRPTHVIVVAPALMCAPVGWLAARCCGAQAWLHLQDLETDAAIRLGLVPPFAARLAHMLERLLLRRFDCVSTISRRMLGKVREKGAHASKLRYLPNWVDTSVIRPAMVTGGLRRELGIEPTDVVVLYSGSMGDKQGLEIIVEVAQQLTHKRELRFVLCGDGSARERLKQLATGQENVRFLPLQPAERLNELLSMADIHILPQRADMADLVMPSKLTAILACGGAVVVTAAPQTELAEVTRAAGGEVCAPGDANEMASRLLRLAGDLRGRLWMREQARQFALEFLDKRKVLSKALRPLTETPAMRDEEHTGAAARLQRRQSTLRMAQP